MKFDLHKKDVSYLKSCCGRKPVVGALVDLEDNTTVFLERYTIYCPVCNRLSSDFSFNIAKSSWNMLISSLEFENGSLIGGLCDEGST